MNNSLYLRAKKIAFIVDVRNWAFDFIAQEIKSKLVKHTEKFEILYWEDYVNPNSIIDYINRGGFELVHFFFREHLNVILSLNDSEGSRLRKLTKVAITTHIPDYLYSSSYELALRSDLFDFIDGYFVTCRDLFELYRNDPIVEDPHSIIFDSPSIPLMNSEIDFEGKDTIKIVWSGNSKWGEYAGFHDYKGLKDVIEPAIKIVEKEISNIEFICFDSAYQKTSRDIILNELVDTDVLLIASEKEGTPLTLIEAISRGCAVITTNVGIATDVLPLIQQEFIVERRPEDFAKAIIKFATNRELLRKIKKENYNAYLSKFLVDGHVVEDWIKFLNCAHEKSLKDGILRKQKIISKLNGSLFRSSLINFLRYSVRIFKKFGIIKVINSISPRFAGFYNNVLHSGSQRGIADYRKVGSLYEVLINKAKKRNNPIVIYAPMWKGVSASTESLFKDSAFRFPYFDSEYPEVKNHIYMDKLAEMLANNYGVPIIYSGGSLIHLVLAEKIREKNKEIKQYILWHGSPAQWTDAGQRQFFYDWKDAFDKKIINKFITLKSGLDLTLCQMNLDALNISNPIPSFNNFKNIKNEDDGIIKIGLFSAISSWYKNPYVQLLSLSGKKNVFLSTNLDGKEIEKMGIDLAGIKSISHLPRGKFLDLLSQQDINLYVTNTECSPMTVLESWSMGVPCIVGPAGDVYKKVSKRLSELLVEVNVDNPKAISDRIDLVYKNMDEIKLLLKENIGNYNDIISKETQYLLEKL